MNYNNGVNFESISLDAIPNNAIKIPVDSFPEINAVVGNLAKEIKEVNQFKGMVKMSYDKSLGHLQKAKIGGFNGNIVNDEGTIVGRANFQEVTNTAAIVSSAMAVMSIITSQYYLHEINQNLDVIQSKIDNISRFLETDKKNHIKSSLHYIQDVQANITDIQNNSIEHQSVLTELQHLEIESYAEYLNFADLISGVIVSMDAAKKEENLQEIIDKITEYVPQLWCAMYLYACSKYLRMILSGITDERRIEGLYQELSQMLNDYDNKVRDYYIDAFDNLNESDVFKANEKLFGAAKMLVGPAGVPGRIINKKAVEEIKEIVQERKDKDKEITIGSFYYDFYNSCKDTEPIQKICEDIGFYNVLFNDSVEFVFDENEVYIIPNDIKKNGVKFFI